MEERRDIRKKPIKSRSIALHLLAAITILLVWAIAAHMYRDLGLFPGPIKVFQALFELPPDELLGNCLASIRRVAVGAGIAIILGTSLGLISASLSRIGDIISLIIEFFRPISPIAWIPLAILWFGVNEPSAYFVIFIAAFFPIFTNSFIGARSVLNIHILVAKSTKISRSSFIRHVLLPSALPHTLTGVRIGLGIAWMAVIASEMVAAQSGLGYSIQINRLLLLSDRVIAGMLIIGIIGFLMNHSIIVIGKIITPWASQENE